MAHTAKVASNQTNSLEGKKILIIGNPSTELEAALHAKGATSLRSAHTPEEITDSAQRNPAGEITGNIVREINTAQADAVLILAQNPVAHEGYDATHPMMPLAKALMENKTPAMLVDATLTHTQATAFQADRKTWCESVNANKPDAIVQKLSSLLTIRNNNKSPAR